MGCGTLASVNGLPGRDKHGSGFEVFSMSDVFHDAVFYGLEGTI